MLVKIVRNHLLKVPAVCGQIANNTSPQKRTSHETETDRIDLTEVIIGFP